LAVYRWLSRYTLPPAAAWQPPSRRTVRMLRRQDRFYADQTVSTCLGAAVPVSGRIQPICTAFYHTEVAEFECAASTERCPTLCAGVAKHNRLSVNNPVSVREILGWSCGSSGRIQPVVLRTIGLSMGSIYAMST
jgi:hypothetical protein